MMILLTSWAGRPVASAILGLGIPSVATPRAVRAAASGAPYGAATARVTVALRVRAPPTASLPQGDVDSGHCAWPARPSFRPMGAVSREDQAKHARDVGFG